MGQNLKNAAMALLVPLPSIFFHVFFLNQLGNNQRDFLPSLHSWCCNHPVLLANVVFFLNVDVLFWIISLVQASHWLIDLYWMVIPVMMVHYYATHPLARYNRLRSVLVMILTSVWSLRLSHSYFRREKWQFGAREDWRFLDLRRRHGHSWWWISFFSVYISQQILIIGITLPFHTIHSVNKPLNKWDFLAGFICSAGIITAYIADTQLHKFMTKNEKLKSLGHPKVLILDTGLWKYSRHPNYVGEQLWWWGLVVFSLNLGQNWGFVGALMNSLCLAYVTVLVERRMLRDEERVEAFRVYQKRTSVWIPWFKSSDVSVKDKSN